MDTTSATPHAAVPPDRVRAFACQSCGAELTFDPAAGMLKCAHCGSTMPVPASPEQPAVAEQSYLADLSRAGREAPTVERIVVHCDSCGANTTFGENVTSTLCAFCAAPLVAQGHSERLIAPQCMLAFQIEETKARHSFRAWIASRWFAPSDLKMVATLDGRLAGVYLPFWTYDSRTRADYTGQRGEHYYVTVNNRRQRRTRWYPAAGTVENTFDDILVYATRTLREPLVDQLEPWPVKNVVPYRDEYLAGFRAESYSLNLEQGFRRAADKMEPTIDATIRRHIGGDEQRILSKNVSYHDVTYKHVLLPAWVAAYRYRGKLYQIVVNAQTGEVCGDRPYSAWKITAAVLGALIVAGIITLFASQR